METPEGILVAVFNSRAHRPALFNLRFQLYILLNCKPDTDYTPLFPFLDKRVKVILPDTRLFYLVNMYNYFTLLIYRSANGDCGRALI